MVVGSSSLLLLFERHKKPRRTIVSPCEAAQDGFVFGFVKYRNCVSVLAGPEGCLAAPHPRGGQKKESCRQPRRLSMETSVSPLVGEKVTSGAPVLEKGKSQGKKGLPGPPALFPGPWRVPEDHRAAAAPEDTLTVCWEQVQVCYRRPAGGAAPRNVVPRCCLTDTSCSSSTY